MIPIRAPRADPVAEQVKVEGHAREQRGIESGMCQERRQPRDDQCSRNIVAQGVVEIRPPEQRRRGVPREYLGNHAESVAVSYTHLTLPTTERV